MRFTAKVDPIGSIQWETDKHAKSTFTMSKDLKTLEGKVERPGSDKISWVTMKRAENQR